MAGQLRLLSAAAVAGAAVGSAAGVLWRSIRWMSFERPERLDLSSLILTLSPHLQFYTVLTNGLMSAREVTPVQIRDDMHHRLASGQRLRFILYSHDQTSYSRWDFDRSIYAIRPSESRSNSTALSLALEPCMAFIARCYINYLESLLVSLLRACNAAGLDSSVLALLSHVRLGGRLYVNFSDNRPSYSGWSFNSSIYAIRPSETRVASTTLGVALETPSVFIAWCFRKYIESLLSSLIRAVNMAGLDASMLQLIRHVSLGRRLTFSYPVEPTISYSLWSFRRSLRARNPSRARNYSSALTVGLQSPAEFLAIIARRYIESIFAMLRVAAIAQLETAASIRPARSTPVQPVSEPGLQNDAELARAVQWRAPVLVIPLELARRLLLVSRDATTISYSRWAFNVSIRARSVSQAPSSSALGALLQSPMEFVARIARNQIEFIMLFVGAVAAARVNNSASNFHGAAIQGDRDGAILEVQVAHQVQTEEVQVVNGPRSTVQQVHPDVGMGPTSFEQPDDSLDFVQMFLRAVTNSETVERERGTGPTIGLQTDVTTMGPTSFAPHHLLDPAMRATRLRAARAARVVDESSAREQPSSRGGYVATFGQTPSQERQLLLPSSSSSLIQPAQPLSSLIRSQNLIRPSSESEPVAVPQTREEAYHQEAVRHQPVMNAVLISPSEPSSRAVDGRSGGYFGACRSPSQERKPLLQPSLQPLLQPASSSSAAAAAFVVPSARDEEGACARYKRKGKELLIDSDISQTRRAEERELQKWAPDAGDELDNCLEWLEQPLNGRKWDQFATNKALFGVQSTYNEDFYTTKLVKGPRTRELEIKAARIAKEIQGEDTADLHLAEERGIVFNSEMDEEMMYSAVTRPDSWRPSNFTQQAVRHQPVMLGAPQGRQGASNYRPGVIHPSREAAVMSAAMSGMEQAPHSSQNAASSSSAAALSASSSAPRAPGVDNKEYKLFIGGLSYGTTAQDLRMIFGRFGAVYKASVPRRSAKQSKGYGFICFESSEDGERARLALHNSELHGRKIRVTMKRDAIH